MGRQVLFKQQVAYESDGLLNYSLPKVPISKVVIRCHGTTGTCTGTYTANTAIEYIQLYINGKLFIDWNGRNGQADKVGYGMQALRDFYEMKHKVAMTAEVWIVELPDALPANASVQLVVKMCNYLSCGCSSDDLGTSTAYKFDILYETEDIVKGKVFVPYITWGRLFPDTSTGNFIEYLPALPYKLRHIILICEDDDTLSDSAVDEITISMGGNILFHGELSSLGDQFQGICKVAHNTGIFHLNFPKGLKVAPDSLEIKAYVSSAGTHTRLHWWAICY